MAILSSVTCSLVPESRGGPFVFWDDIDAAIKSAANMGFDGFELFAPGPNAVDSATLQKLLGDNGLRLAAVGTGAGWVQRKLQLTSADANNRQQAIAFVKSMIDFGAPFGAPAIIGSMQGRWDNAENRAPATQRLIDALNELGEHAGQRNVRLIYEPLNRYETNFVNTMEQGVAFLKQLTTKNVVLLADLFHMNIEEQDLASALRIGGAAIGHIHFVDSNRRPAGLGHLDYAPIAQAIRDIAYDGFLSAEALSYPSPAEAAQQTITKFKQLFPRIKA